MSSKLAHNTPKGDSPISLQIPTAQQSTSQNTKTIKNEYEYHVQPVSDLQWFTLNLKTIEIQQEKSQELVYKPKVSEGKLYVNYIKRRIWD